MTPRKLKVFFHLFSYSGSGSVPACAPSTYQWLLKVIPQAKADHRIESVALADVGDTPVTMVRNRAVVAAREMGADVLVMMDADCYPDFRLGRDPDARPFWDTSFDFLYEHYDRGPVVVGAPYCGPPSAELCYVFEWGSWQSDHPNIDCQLKMISREDAAVRAGIQQCAALPTGLIMFDVRAFELTEPKAKREGLFERLMGPVRSQMAGGQALTLAQIEEFCDRCLEARLRAEQSWFYYEWTDQFQQQKASTEDVTATRDLAAHGLLKLGYNPLRVNWDAWAGHWKVKCVDKPAVLSADDVNAKLLRAAREGASRSERLVELDLE